MKNSKISSTSTQIILTMSIASFSKLVKRYLSSLPTNDYPVLDTQTFVSCWLSFSLDKSLTSMRDLFRRLNLRNIPLKISTFSKASKHRGLQVFRQILEKVKADVAQRFPQKENPLFALDSTIITLTSKLM